MPSSKGKSVEDLIVYVGNEVLEITPKIIGLRNLPNAIIKSKYNHGEQQVRYPVH
jgi:hypothetical protein